jgi:hypothetical protein
MSCQRKHTSACVNPTFRQTCNSKTEAECKLFLPFPPRMTDEEYIRKQTKLLKDIPKELHAALSYMAYERGHSAGNEEIVIELHDLVSGLQEPLKNYEARVRMDCLNRVSS